MKRQKLILSIIALALMAGTALLLAVVPQKLGQPGVKTRPIPGSTRCQIDLPESLPGFASENQEEDAKALEMLPPDTSFAERKYYKPGTLPVYGSVVLMGTDRTSIHKAEYCLQGQGIHIDQATKETIHMTEPYPYDLPVIKIVGNRQVSDGGKTQSCVYVYWYVADGQLSNDRSGFERMSSMAKHLVFNGVLQRWAYVRFYMLCDPGTEDAAFGQIKDVIVAAVPQFQLTPRPGAFETTQH